VTVFGESWGAGSASYHMLSDKSRGLFHRAILMSGTALNGIYTYFPQRNWALRLALKIGYAGPHDDKSILEFLEAADEKELVIASGHILTDREKNEEGFMFPFGPVIEKYDNGSAFITDSIIEMIRKGWGNDIDIMIGNTSNECLSLVAMLKTQDALDTQKHFTRFVPRELELSLDSDKMRECAEILKKYYYGALEPTLTNLEGLIQVSNDAFLWHPMYRSNMMRLTHGRGKTFNYRFDYVTENNLFRKMFKFDDSIPEATHGDDVGYIFRFQELEGDDFKLALNSKAFEGIKTMVAVFTEFAKTGNPNVHHLKDVEWTPATLEQPFWGINLSEKGSKMMELPEYQRVKVFNQFFHSGGSTHL
jgi:carboxylesterase type B